MNNISKELSDALVKLINGVIDGVDFLAGEIPDVINQLLLWKMTASLLQFSGGLLICFTLLVVLIKYCGQGTFDLSTGLYNQTLSHTSDGKIGERITLTIPGSIVVLVIGLALIDFDWLKIIIAPKVYLIDYASNMIK